MDIMWKEDREIMLTQYKYPDHENKQCVPPYYNLENIFNKVFNNDYEKHFGKNKKIDYFTTK